MQLSAEQCLTNWSHSPQRHYAGVYQRVREFDHYVWWCNYLAVVDMMSRDECIQQTEIAVSEKEAVIEYCYLPGIV